MRSDQILARTMRYGDELTLLEQGKKVEREQFIENSYNPLTTMPQMLKQRVFSKTEDVRRWEKRSAYVPRPEPRTHADYMVRHGWACGCDYCGKRVWA